MARPQASYRAARRNRALKEKPRSVWRGVPKTGWRSQDQGRFEQPEVAAMRAAAPKRTKVAR